MTIQIAKVIFLMNLSIMKKILDLVSFKFDKRTSEYKYMKSQIMDYFYHGMGKLFKQLSDKKIIEKCKCGTSIRNGYKRCDCGGSGFVNMEKKIAI